jgi:mannose-6-phosphate isomerase-like protein (cupin superfamily)
VNETIADKTKNEKVGFNDMVLSWLVNEQNARSENVAVGHTHKPPGGEHKLHLHKNAEEVIFMLKGKGVEICGDKEIELKTGDCIYIPRGMPHSHKNSGNEPSETIFVYAGAPSFEKTGYVLLENKR